MNPEETCPVCGKPDYETFTAGDGELSVRALSHISCVVAETKRAGEAERPASAGHGAADFWMQAESEQQKRAEKAEAELAALKAKYDFVTTEACGNDWTSIAELESRWTARKEPE